MENSQATIITRTKPEKIVFLLGNLQNLNVKTSGSL